MKYLQKLEKEIEAIQWTGELGCLDAIQVFMYPQSPMRRKDDKSLTIGTGSWSSEIVKELDYIIKMPDGQFVKMAKDDFEKFYCSYQDLNGDFKGSETLKGEEVQTND